MGLLLLLLLLLLLFLLFLGLNSFIKSGKEEIQKIFDKLLDEEDMVKNLVRQQKIEMNKKNSSMIIARKRALTTVQAYVMRNKQDIWSKCIKDPNMVRIFIHNYSYIFIYLFYLFIYLF